MHLIEFYLKKLIKISEISLLFLFSKPIFQSNKTHYNLLVLKLSYIIVLGTCILRIELYYICIDCMFLNLTTPVINFNFSL